MQSGPAPTDATPIDLSPMDKPAALRIKPFGPMSSEPERAPATESTRSISEAPSQLQSTHQASQRVALDVDSSPEIDTDNNPFADPANGDDMEMKTSSSWEVAEVIESLNDSPVEVSPVTKEDVEA